MALCSLPPQSTHTTELRRHARFRFQGRAWCEHRDWTLYLAVANVSCEGMCLQTPAPFVAGERLRVCISESEPRIVAELEVVWSARGRSPGIGCRITSFAEGPESYRRLLERLGQSAR